MIYFREVEDTKRTEYPLEWGCETFTCITAYTFTVIKNNRDRMSHIEKDVVVPPCTFLVRISGDFQTLQVLYLSPSMMKKTLLSSKCP